ncbi:MAG: hypothetical protein J6B68_09615 [Lachnospiraceae bacterium]|nr:hypothetical protein [Lachnospiraceae bacterium]
MAYISEIDVRNNRFKYIRDFMIPEEVYLNTIDWSLVKSDCGMPEDAPICGLGRNYIKFGEAVNVGEVKEFHINVYDIRYRKSVLSTQFFYLCDEVYYWRNNYAIQELFYTSFSDVWCEHKKKYEVINSGYYPIVGLLDKMRLIDSDFAGKYREGTENIFYESNW